MQTLSALIVLGAVVFLGFQVRGLVLAIIARVKKRKEADNEGTQE